MTLTQRKNSKQYQQSKQNKDTQQETDKNGKDKLPRFTIWNSIVSGCFFGSNDEETILLAQQKAEARRERKRQRILALKQEIAEMDRKFAQQRTEMDRKFAQQRTETDRKLLCERIKRTEEKRRYNHRGESGLGSAPMVFV